MRALVIYESMYGNTRSITEAIADGMREPEDVQLMRMERTTGFEPATLTLARLRNPSVVSTACCRVGRQRPCSPWRPPRPRIQPE